MNDCWSLDVKHNDHVAAAAPDARRDSAAIASVRFACHFVDKCDGRIPGAIRRLLRRAEYLGARRLEVWAFKARTIRFYEAAGWLRGQPDRRGRAQRSRLDLRRSGWRAGPLTQNSFC